MALFFLGSIAMRSAGCIINDWWDREIDAQVARTRNRPLASGALQPWQAGIVLGLLLLLSLWIVWQLPRIVLWLAFASLPLVGFYPLMKRWIAIPQAFLGLTFNFGALMGWAAVRGTIEPPALWLYAAGICWTLGYDTLYAFQDKTDDQKIGIHSSAQFFGKASRGWIAGFYALMLFFLALAGVNGVSCLLLALPLLWQLYRLESENIARCARQFHFHALVGGMVWLLLLAQKFI
jgi:4-hydroxybenzoate polyprenyltransferase